MSFDEIVSRLPDTDQKTIRDMMVLFDAIDRQTKEFSNQTGLKCKNGCGACCENPNVETTVAEVLPLAVYLWSNGLAPDKLEAIQSSSTKSTCIFYKPDPFVKGQGRCSVYAYRPGLCRLFGFSARKDKYGKPTLVACKVIKASQPQACANAQKELQKGLKAPLLSTHAYAVANIDPVHGQKLLPINQAIRLAVERVGYVRTTNKGPFT